MPTFQVDLGKCRRDGICSKVCPAMIINNDAEGVPFLVPGGAERCIGCGQCVAFCPHDACSLDGLPMDKAERVNRKILPSPESAAELLKTRRSVRVFSEKMVPREVLENIIRTASYAPTAKNQREVRWVMVENAEKIHRVISLVGDFFDQIAGPKPATPAERSYKVMANMIQKGKDPVLRGARQLAVAVTQEGHFGKIDAAIALSYFEIAAHSLGVGCCWAGYFTSACEHSEELRKLVGVRDGEAVGGGQMVGYPAIRATSLPPRAELSVDWI